MNDEDLLRPETPPETTAEQQPEALPDPPQQADLQPVPVEPAEQPAAEPAPDAAAAQAANDERRRIARERWERLAAAHGSGEVVHGTVKSAVKGGLLVEIDGYRGFLPASQVRGEKGRPLDQLVGTDVPLKVIDVDQTRKRVVVSHRRAMEEERRASRAELLASLKVGEMREVRVARLVDFGAFVELGHGVDALIPMSELAFERVEKAADVLTPGDTLRVRVMRIDQGGKKISVSRKAALDDPWRDHADVLRNGNVVEGRVVATTPRLEVEIAPGVIGSISDREANPEEYEIGEAVEVSVRNVDFRNRRLRLSTLHGAAAAPQRSGGFAPLGVELGR